MTADRHSSPSTMATQLCVAANVAVYPLGAQENGIPVIYVAPLPHGPLAVLSDMAALIWQEAFEGPEETLAFRVARRLDGAVSPQEIDHDVAHFVESLLERGLVDRRRGPAA